MSATARHDEPRGLRALKLRLLATRPFAALERSLPFRLLVWRAAPRAFRVVRPLLPFPAAVLETRDARNGRPHRRVVVTCADGDDVLVVPSRGGGGRDPFWLENALAEPLVRLDGAPFRAEVVAGSAAGAAGAAGASAPAERLWRRVEAAYPATATHRRHAARHGRTVRLLRLVRLSDR